MQRSSGMDHVENALADSAVLLAQDAGREQIEEAAALGDGIEAADDQTVGDMLRVLHDRAKILMRRIVIMSERAKRGIAEHRAVLAAMRRGDALEAERLRRETIA
jgi:hypothetical protein